MLLYPFQEKIVSDARAAWTKYKHICIQAPTGAGKTVIFTYIVNRFAASKNRVWVVVPRNELLTQSSNTMSVFDITHGRIAAGLNESKAYNVHVVSKDTLIRRYDKIINPPDIIIIDECHIALDRQIEIKKQFPDCRFIGFTATPERQDGRGLSEMYDTLIMGTALYELVELGYLSTPEYYAIENAEIENLGRMGTEVKPKELEELFDRRAVYGDIIKHYKRLADGKPTICFCRNIAACKKTASEFRDAGYKFENIDGGMSDKKRNALLDALRSGDIQGLCSADLLTYGVDVKNVECIILLRPTDSTALYFQMIGRGLRVLEGKTSCVIIDHVNNLFRHGHPLSPREWNFYGTKKKKAKVDEEIRLRLCPDTLMYCTKQSCIGCIHNTTERKSLDAHIVECELVEVKNPVALQDRPLEQCKIYAEKILKAKADGCIASMLKIADALGNQPIWAYWELNKGRLSINVPMLHEIRRIKEYKNGWIWNQQKIIERKLGR